LEIYQAAQVLMENTTHIAPASETRLKTEISDPYMRQHLRNINCFVNRPMLPKGVSGIMQIEAPLFFCF
jgi:hypothetical protein